MSLDYIFLDMWRCMGLEVFLLTACPSVDIFVQLHWADVRCVVDQGSADADDTPPPACWPEPVAAASVRSCETSVTGRTGDTA